MRLTKKQIELIKSCWKKGEITYRDMCSFYTTAIHRKQVIEHLKSLRIIKEERFIFKLDRDRFVEIQKEGI